jgi:pimeloyl-ACP methyl ester carboxylesterase
MVATYLADDGVRLHVEIDGAATGPTAVLVHGLAGSTALQWRAMSVTPSLVSEGVRVVAFDLRGHGQSEAPHDRHSYGDARMVADLVGVIDEFAGGDATVVGYSMGAAVTLLALESGLNVKSALVGAAPPAVLRWTADDEAVRSAAIGALEGETEPDPAMSAWLEFLDSMGSDRAALAAALAGHRPVVEHWDRITVPIVVAAGKDDVMAAPPDEVASRLPDARAVVVPGDHISAAASREFIDAIIQVVRA